ncbi:MAG: phage tail protein I, partial [Anaerolineae bacterium]
VGSTATLGAVNLIAPEDYGVPLFEGVAHRFVIWLYRGQVNDEVLATVQAVVDAEKPAHVDYMISIIEPTMRLGQQSTLGIDAVLAKEGHMSVDSLDGVQLAGETAMNLNRNTRLGKNSTI